MIAGMILECPGTRGCRDGPAMLDRVPLSLGEVSSRSSCSDDDTGIVYIIKYDVCDDD
jgi:hypothetical protein